MNDLLGILSSLDDNAYKVLITTVALIVFTIITSSTKLIYDYRVKENSLDIIIFGGIFVYHIPFDDIQSIRMASWNDIKLDFQTMRIGNSFSNKKVLVTRKVGKYYKVIITPGNAEQFVLVAQEKIKRHQGQC